MSTHRQCGDDRWNSAVGRAKGTKEESRALNAYLDLLQAKVFEAEHEMTQAGELITSDALRNKLLGKGEQPYLLTDIIIEHNDRVRQLIGKGFAKATWTKYETTLKHIGNFLQWKYSKKRCCYPRSPTSFHY